MWLTDSIGIAFCLSKALHILQVHHTHTTIYMACK